MKLLEYPNQTFRILGLTLPFTHKEEGRHIMEYWYSQNSHINQGSYILKSWIPLGYMSTILGAKQTSNSRPYEAYLLVQGNKGSKIVPGDMQLVFFLLSNDNRYK